MTLPNDSIESRSRQPLAPWTGRFPSRRTSVALPLFATLLLIYSGSAKAAVVINATSGLLIDVASAIATAADGDTVVIPSGTVSWTSTLSVTKNISLIGAGIDQTIIIDEIDKTNPSNALMSFNTTLGKNLRLSGMTIKGGTTGRAQTVVHNGSIAIGGKSQAVRVDHVKFDHEYNDNIQFYGQVYGVVDHCVFNEIQNATHGIVVFHDGWNGVPYGDGSWADDTYLGTNKAIYVEDCTFTGAGVVGDIDGRCGSRFVYRYNHSDSYVGCHGTESSGRLRSVRTYEIYNNVLNGATITPGPWPWAVYLRGGTGVIFNNTFTGFTYAVACDNYRSIANFPPWGGADGTNGWDSNDPTVYATGSHTGANGATSLTTTGTTWTTNQWVGYQIRNKTTGNFAEISGNTSNTITYKPPNNGPSMTFNTGNSFDIRKVLVALDQCGRGKGALISGDTPGPVAWPHNALEPIYQWNNTLNGASNPVIVNNASLLKVNRDFYNNTPMPGYTPYVYPHPLVTGGAVASPPAPANLRVLPGP